MTPEEIAAFKASIVTEVSSQLNAHFRDALENLSEENARLKAEARNQNAFVEMLEKLSLQTATVAESLQGKTGHSPKIDIKISKPNKYSGKRDAPLLKSFVTACRRYFKHVPETMSHYEKLDLFEEFLEGDAETWYMTVKPTLVGDVSKHIDAVEQEFMPTNVEDKARNELKKLRVGKSYSVFLNKFTKWRTQIPNLTEPEAFEYFRGALTGDFLKDVCRDGCTTLTAAMQTCSKTEKYLDQMAAIASGRSAVGSENEGSDDPMEVDAVAVKKKSFQFKKDKKSEKQGSEKKNAIDLDKIPTATLGRLMKEKRCLRCGEEGHHYVKCSNPQKDFEQE
jgi:hypothetical protein